MKKLCCIPCNETPNIDVSFECLSSCRQSKTVKRVVRETEAVKQEEEVKQVQTEEAS